MAGNSNSGRRRKPTHLKLVEGRQYRLNKNEPIPKGDLVEAPNFLTSEQRAKWDQAISDAPYGLLKRLDGPALACWVVAYSLYVEAVEALKNGPRIIKSPNGMPVQSPWVGILNKQALIMQRLSLDLGFSPAARSRVSADFEDQEHDPAERFFGPVR
jgi:P27 family predicted phage terminase small subunit